MTAFQVIEKARFLRAQGRLDEALATLEAPTEFSADLCALRGAIEFALGRHSDAALSFSAVAANRPRDARAHYNLALCLERWWGCCPGSVRSGKARHNSTWSTCQISTEFGKTW